MPMLPAEGQEWESLMRKYDDLAPKTVWKRICFLLDPFLSVVQDEATKRGRLEGRPEFG